MSFTKLSKTLVYSGKLLPIQSGHTVTIAGRTRPAAEYFDFFFGSDDGSDTNFGDIQFHVMIHFVGPRDIVRNAYTKNVGWGEGCEEHEKNRFGSSPNPIKPGEDFKISISAYEDFFFMTINGKPFCSYSYRKPLKDIERINVYGDVEHIYEVSHTLTKLDLAEPTDGFKGSHPMVKSGAAMVFNGIPRESAGGQFLIRLTESDTGREIFQLNVNFQTNETR